MEADTVRRVGIIGVGEIGKAIVEGLRGGGGASPEVFLSPRGARVATGALIVRAIPLPAVRERRSVTVTCPSHPAVDALFERLGGALPVADEDAFNVFSALTGTLTAHYAYLPTLTSWATGHGIAPDAADRYVRGLFRNVGRSLNDETRPPHQLAADHETPGGNNEADSHHVVRSGQRRGPQAGPGRPPLRSGVTASRLRLASATWNGDPLHASR
ncbi:hypothetical protein [Streptomyces triticirhizae]|uniref:hypothetical protein n=1 Tax=Streptomyces triticirhizae TaxID=2483353 RepID=UPI001F1CF677|nr:hypothetical protein [Streptomyces triticirhizae]